MMSVLASIRRGGKTLGQMVKEEIGPGVGLLALVSVLAIMIILLAVLALVVVQALAESPWGVFTIAVTIPIAIIMGMRSAHGKGECSRCHNIRITRSGIRCLGWAVSWPFSRD